MKVLYGFLALLGIVLPYSQLIPWIYEHGLQLPLLIEEAARTRIGSFAWLDVIVSVVVLLVFIRYEGKRTGMKMSLCWIPILGTLTVGVSFGLPMFLMLRELHLKKMTVE